jgi:hypothetical protein
VTIIQTVTVAAPQPAVQSPQAPTHMNTPIVRDPIPEARGCAESPPQMQPPVIVAAAPLAVPGIATPVPQATSPVDRDMVTLRRELFDLLERFDKTPDRRVIVLNWMDQQFGTKRVVELDRLQLLRTVRWSSVVLKDRQKKREERGTVVR